MVPDAAGRNDRDDEEKRAPTQASEGRGLGML